MDALEKLQQHFKEFPGIGPRQARRFVDFLLQSDGSFVENLSREIAAVKQHANQCDQCGRFFFAANGSGKKCNICRDKKRDHKILMVVAHDPDIDAIEQTGIYKGVYFVLGGLLPVVEKAPEDQIRIGALLKHVDNVADDLSEIILALPVNPEGENTSTFVKNKLEDIAGTHNITISTLGRGLSTGTELEYIDNQTFESALANRT